MIPGDLSKYYEIPESPELARTLGRVEALRSEIDDLRPMGGDLWRTVQFKLKAEWTQGSNAIEGSTLDLRETVFFLREGLTVEGKPLKDFLDARNHAEAIDMVGDAVENKRSVSTGFIKEINAMIMNGVDFTPARDAQGRPVKKPATPGMYKRHPNHVLKPDGGIHRYVEPEQVAAQMDGLCAWINDNSQVRPVQVAALAHYNMVRIHPFDDGNGRGARLLMNMILMKVGHVPAVIRNEQRREYLSAIIQADAGDLEPFCLFVARALENTQSGVLSAVSG